MIVMLDTNTDMDICARELNCDVEQLFTPLTRRNPQRPGERFAMDNGAFSKFSPKAFLAMLAKHEPRKALCRFVAAPDVVGSAIRTSECFDLWLERLSGWPVAYVCQDGQESIPIPWTRVAAIFIGGSTQWKLGPHASACIRAAKVAGVWCHVGRVNSPGRFRYFDDLGADSIDGTGLARYSHMRSAIQNTEHQKDMFGI